MRRAWSYRWSIGGEDQHEGGLKRVTLRPARGGAGMVPFWMGDAHQYGHPRRYQAVRTAAGLFDLSVACR